jgi:hypothetical protein
VSSCLEVFAADIAETPKQAIENTRHTRRLKPTSTDFNPTSTLIKIMEVNYLGIMIGFPVLLGFALTTLGIRYYFVKQEMRNIRTRNEMAMSRVHEDELDPPRAPEL